MRNRWIIRALAFVVLAILVDRALAALLDAGFSRIEVGESGGITNATLHAKADVLVVGSSRAWRHYDTKVLTEAFGLACYNAGVDGQGLPYMRGVLDLVLRRHVPKYLIVDLSAGLFADDTDPFDRAMILAPFIDESLVVRDILYSRGPLEPLKYLCRSFRYNSVALAIVRNLGRRNTTLSGFNPLDRVFVPPRAATEPLANPGVSPIEPAGRMVKLLEDMIVAAKAEGVRVVLVRSPRWSAGTHTSQRGARVDPVVENLAMRHGVPYIRIGPENDAAFRDASLFADAGHLNRRGARLFTERLVTIMAERGILASGR